MLARLAWMLCLLTALGDGAQANPPADTILINGSIASFHGTPMRAAEEAPSRTEALRLYTQGSAWFTHDDARRGALEVDKLADIAVLSKDYFSVALDEVGSIRALLTMVDGRIVYADGPYAQLEDRPLPVKPRRAGRVE